MQKYLFVILILLASCGPEPEPVDEVIGSPVFYVEGDVNGTPVKIGAGLDNYKLDPSYGEDTSGLLVFSASLADKDCPACGPSLRVIIRNYTTKNQFVSDSSLFEGEYMYYDPKLPARTYYEATYISQSKGNGTPDHTWYFGNGKNASGAVASVRYDAPGEYEVFHTNQFSSGCASNIRQYVRVPSLFDGLYIDFNTNYLAPRKILFNSIPVDNEAEVSWDFGDGEIGTGTIAEHVYDTPGTYRVCMVFDKGDSLKFCKNVQTSDASQCVSNFKFNVATVKDSLQLSGVTIEWRDVNGKLYSSDNVKQDNIPFEVLEKGVYEPNEKGEPTMKLKVHFSCKVSDGTKTIFLNNMTAVIAVGHP